MHYQNRSFCLRIKEVGRLPYNYPDDPHIDVELKIADWTGERPSQLDIFLHDPTVSGDR